MQKAKLFLSLLGFSAVFSTLFAFNISRYASHFIYTGTLGSGVCTTKTNGAGILCYGTPIVAASTTSLSSGCPNAYTTEIAD
jgi:hypothetical protein